jgi:hypothetical protein
MSTLALSPYDSETELQRYGRITVKARAKVDVWIEAFRTVSRPVSRSLERIARDMRAAVPTVRTKWYAYQREGWTALIDWRLVPDGEITLPAEDIEAFQTYCLANKRKSAPGWREMISDWKDGKIRTRQPVNPLTGLPSGWSYNNFMRQRPSDYMLGRARVGVQAARKFRPQMLHTRAGTRVGQFYLWDDNVYDVKVNVLGVHRTHCRPLGLTAQDLTSAFPLANGYKPSLTEELEAKKQALRKKDMAWFVAHVLLSRGYRKDEIGTTFLVENGTATLDEKWARHLQDTLGIRTEWAGIDQRPAMAGMFKGVARGSSNFKAWMESTFNLLRNEMAALPGPTGMDYDHAPEESDALEANNRLMLAVMDSLPAWRRDEIRTRLMSWDTFLLMAERAWDRISNRTDHDLEGWQQLGFVTTEWRADASLGWSPMQALLSLPAPAQAGITALIDSNPLLSRARKLSPQEAFSRHADELHRPALWQLPLILPPDYYTERKLTARHWFEFEDADIGAGDFIFNGEILTPQNRREWLTPGETYRTYTNPFDPQSMVVCDVRGTVLGISSRADRVSRGDAEGQQNRLRDLRRQEAELARPLARLGRDQLRQEIQRTAHNVSVLGNQSGATAARRVRNTFSDSSNELLGETGLPAGTDPARAGSAEPLDSNDLL